MENIDEIRLAWSLYIQGLAINIGQELSFLKLFLTKFLIEI